MKKVETISLKDLLIAEEKAKKQINVEEIDDSKFYHEKSQSLRNEHVLDEELPIDKKMQVIDIDIANFNSRIAKLLHTYYFLKLFSKTASKNELFNRDSLNLDKYINEIKKAYEKIKKQNNNLKKIEIINEQEVKDLYYSINDLYDFCRGLENDVILLQKNYYPVLKMASYSICSEKSYEEVEQLQSIVNKELYTYKNISEAYDYICFNSGELVVDVVKMILNILKKNNIIGIAYNYFLPTDAIINFSYQEWIELYSKIQYIKKRSNIKKIYSSDGEYQKLYFEFEKRYAIVLIYNEYITSIRKKKI